MIYWLTFMVEGFIPLQQRPGSNSCLPTAITAILRYYGHDVTQSQISDWCREGPEGCVIDLAIEGLREEDCEVTELTEDPENEMREHVNDAEDPTPVLVTIKPAFSEIMDHAVVVLGLDNEESEDARVTLMDPLSGHIATMKAALFFLQWDNAGQLAFVIRA